MAATSRFLVGWLFLVAAGFLPHAYGQEGAATTSRYDLLHREVVQAALGMSDIQRTSLEKWVLERNMLLMRFHNQIAHGPPADRDAARQRQREALAEHEQKLDALLSPQQRERAAQLVIQVAISADDAHGGLTHPRMIEALKLTEAEVQAVREKAPAVQAQLQQRLTRLRAELAQAHAEARQELVQHLTADQQAQYQALLGPPLDLWRPLPSPPAAGKIGER